MLSWHLNATSVLLTQFKQSKVFVALKTWYVTQSGGRLLHLRRLVTLSSTSFLNWSKLFLLAEEQHPKPDKRPTLLTFHRLSDAVPAEIYISLTVISHSMYRCETRCTNYSIKTSCIWKKDHSDRVSLSSLSCKTPAIWLKYQDFSESPKTLVVNK